MTGIRSAQELDAAQERASREERTARAHYRIHGDIYRKIPQSCAHRECAVPHGDGIAEYPQCADAGASVEGHIVYPGYVLSELDGAVYPDAPSEGVVTDTCYPVTYRDRDPVQTLIPGCRNVLFTVIEAVTRTDETDRRESRTASEHRIGCINDRIR